VYVPSPSIYRDVRQGVPAVLQSLGPHQSGIRRPRPHVHARIQDSISNFDEILHIFEVLFAWRCDYIQKHGRVLACHTFHNYDLTEIDEKVLFARIQNLGEIVRVRVTAGAAGWDKPRPGVVSINRSMFSNSGPGRGPARGDGSEGGTPGLLPEGETGLDESGTGACEAEEGNESKAACPHAADVKIIDFAFS
jgi:hypothetical protein